MDKIDGFDPEMWARARRCWLAAPRFNGSTARELRGAARRNLHRAWTFTDDRKDAPGFSLFSGCNAPLPDSTGETTRASIEGRPGGDPRRTVGRDCGIHVIGDSGEGGHLAADDAPGSPDVEPPEAGLNHPGNRAGGQEQEDQRAAQRNRYVQFGQFDIIARLTPTVEGQPNGTQVNYFNCDRSRHFRGLFSKTPRADIAANDQVARRRLRRPARLETPSGGIAESPRPLGEIASAVLGWWRVKHRAARHAATAKRRNTAISSSVASEIGPSLTRKASQILIARPQ